MAFLLQQIWNTPNTHECSLQFAMLEKAFEPWKVHFQSWMSVGCLLCLSYDFPVQFNNNNSRKWLHANWNGMNGFVCVKNEAKYKLYPILLLILKCIPFGKSHLNIPRLFAISLIESISIITFNHLFTLLLNIRHFVISQFSIWELTTLEWRIVYFQITSNVNQNNLNHPKHS